LFYVRIEADEDRSARVVPTERGRAKADEARPLWVRAQRCFEGKVVRKESPCSARDF
jgi:hypothetical protein